MYSSTYIIKCVIAQSRGRNYGIAFDAMVSGRKTFAELAPASQNAIRQVLKDLTVVGELRFEAGKLLREHNIER